MSSKADYTKQQISYTLLQLLQKYPIENITISPLVQQAKVSRSAFYNNYKNLEDVIKDAYYQAYDECFKDKSKNIDYLFSDKFIKDNIDFFDKNTNLLKALYKWNLVEYIAKEKTNLSNQLVKQSNNKIINQYSHYFTIYTSITYFNICMAWIINNKQESKEELFEMIKSFKEIEHSYYQK